VRRLRHIRSDGTVVIEHESAAAHCVLALLPAGAIASLAWFWEPTGADGRVLVTASFLLVAGVLLMLAWRRRRSVHVGRDSTLSWETGIESDDPYVVTLVQNGQREPLLEADDPARVIADARRIARETGAALVGPEWVVEPRGVSRAPRALATLHEEGLLWPAQLRASRTSVLAGLFVLVLSVGSIHAESEVSVLSAALPGLSVALALLIGAMLARMRVRIDSGPDGLRAERRGLSGARELLRLAAADILDVHAVGHASHAERHLVIETVNGPVAVACAEDTARRVASSWSQNASRAIGGT
jgi:hypothetical protein